MKMSAIHDSVPGLDLMRSIAEPELTAPMHNVVMRRLPHCLGTLPAAAHIDPRAQAGSVREFRQPVVRDRLVQHLARSDDSLTHNAGPPMSRFPDAHHLRCAGKC